MAEEMVSACFVAVDMNVGQKKEPPGKVAAFGSAAPQRDSEAKSNTGLKPGTSLRLKFSGLCTEYKLGFAL